MSAKSEASTSYVQSVQSALELLESVHVLKLSTLSELARYTGFSLNQTFRLIATLEHKGYVSKDSLKRYRLSSKLHVLSQGAEWPHALIVAAKTHMEKLAALSGETALLSVPVGLERMIVLQIPSTHSLQVNYPIGSRVPLYVGGMGVAMLAFLPDKQIELLANQITPFTEFTPDKYGLRSELEKVKKEGVRVSKDDYALGEFSVASPITTKSGQAHAAVAIAGFTARLNGETLSRYVPAVVNAAQAISDKLNGEKAV